MIDKVPGLETGVRYSNPPLMGDGRKPFPYPMQDALEYYNKRERAYRPCTH